MQRSLIVVTVLIFVVLPEAFASEAISVSELAILNENGASAQDFNTGDKLLIRSSFQNNNQLEQGFVYIVQVQDSSGYTVFLSWISETFQENHTLDISWEPEKEDSYIVQGFVWTSIDSPAPLSFAVQKAIVDFKTQVIAHCGSAKCFISNVTKVTDGDTLRVDDIPV